MMVFYQNPVQLIFIFVEIVETGLKFYNDGDQYTNGNTCSEPGNIKYTIIFVPGQTPDGSFDIIEQHVMGVDGKNPPDAAKKMPFFN
jgi:hypothetical protein